MTPLDYTLNDLKRRVADLEREKREMQRELESQQRAKREMKSEIESQKNNLELIGMMLMFAASIGIILLAAR